MSKFVYILFLSFGSSSLCNLLSNHLHFSGEIYKCKGISKPSIWFVKLWKHSKNPSAYFPNRWCECKLIRATETLIGSVSALVYVLYSFWSFNISYGEDWIMWVVASVTSWPCTLWYVNWTTGFSARIQPKWSLWHWLIYISWKNIWLKQRIRVRKIWTDRNKEYV